MADDADSKSVVGNHVWVQVPLPALQEEYPMDALFYCILIHHKKAVTQGIN